MPDAETMTADPFELATAAAIADLQAALRATAPGGELAEDAVGHGRIRLRDRPVAPEAEPEPAAEPATTTPEPDAAADTVPGGPGPGPVGHGTIRLHGRP